SANFSAGSCQITLLGSGFTNSGGIAGPWGVALDGAGNVFIADASNYAVSEIPRVESVGLTFPITQVGYASASDTTPPYVTMQNIGTSALTFTPAVATGANPVPAANFALDGSSSSCAQTGADGTPASLASSAACTLVFNFVPTVGGLLSEDALLTDNSLNVAGATQSIPLSGVGVEIVISPTTLTDGVFGTAYSQTLTASGSPTAGATYSFAVTSGSLPPGLSLSTAGVISGVPTAVGSYSFTATATDNTAPVSGGPFTGTRDYTLVVINPADFAVSVAPTSQPALPGTLVSYTVTVTSVTAPFTDQVTLQATITPSGPTASFTPQQVIPGAIGSGATSTMTIHVPVQGARLTPNLGMKAPLTLTALLLPLAAFWRGKKKIRLLVLLLAGLAGFSAMTGCGPGGYFSQPQQSYTIIVTGTSGNLSHSATPVTLTVE
ncbi:MAG: putative Ig domain-containing protein, partial [Acidobacteriaceae bacterium]|nr:putative Ig domain-containing protein [Acidobacteriaceae bacterium]